MSFTLETVPAGHGLLTQKERDKSYREKRGNEYRTSNAARMRKSRATALPKFYGVDSEGIGEGKNHRAILVGCGTGSYTCKDRRKGLQWDEVFDYLYGEFERDPKGVYVGFYLKYDFDQWLKTLPEHAAWKLFKGKHVRTAMARSKTGEIHEVTYPVRVKGWEFDMPMGYKQLMIRRRACQCEEKCDHKTTSSWMYINDAGPFFQSSLLGALDPEGWIDDPKGPICSQEVYDFLEEWKKRRGKFQWSDLPSLRKYNIEENIQLCNLMDRLAKAFSDMEIHLAPKEWYGPGSVAAKWLRKNAIPRNKDLDLDREFLEDCRRSYYGGWFEIFSHGIIRGESWNYDINSAYPFATTQLPHICGSCRVNRREGSYKGSSPYVLLYCTVRGHSDRVGPLPFRDKRGRSYRPATTRGWYWKFEVDAARNAGLINEKYHKRIGLLPAFEVHEYAEFIPCGHSAPFEDLVRLYNLRLDEHGNKVRSAFALAVKLIINSIYGKLAQSIGSAPYNNWFYASLITARCRAQILDAIATHPGKADSVLMVATDGICFDSRHPSLDIGVALGAWEEKKYTDLCLFKPGVYWHKEGKDNLEKLKVKSRGVPREEFAKHIEEVEAIFRSYRPGKFAGKFYGPTADDYEPFPAFEVTVEFRLKSCKSAIHEGKWGSAGLMMNDFPLWQTSEPRDKRRPPGVGGVFWNKKKKRIDSKHAWQSDGDIQTVYHNEYKTPPGKSLGVSFDGDPQAGIIEMIAAVRDHHVYEDEDPLEHQAQADSDSPVRRMR